MFKRHCLFNGKFIAAPMFSPQIAQKNSRWRIIFLTLIISIISNSGGRDHKTKHSRSWLITTRSEWSHSQISVIGNVSAEYMIYLNISYYRLLATKGVSRFFLRISAWSFSWNENPHILLTRGFICILPLLWEKFKLLWCYKMPLITW